MAQLVAHEQLVRAPGGRRQADPAGSSVTLKINASAGRLMPANELLWL